MKIGFAQFAPDFGEVEKNVKSIERLITSTDADLLVFPELATTGYTFVSQEEAQASAEPFATSASLDRIQTLAAKQSCAVVTGFAESADEGVYNSAALLRPDGSRELYRKIHLFGAEKLFFRPGNQPFAVHDYNGVKIGMIVCFDWYYPESIRVLTLKGAQIICQPANLVLQWCQRAMIIRSVENRVFTVTANRYGAENRGEYSYAFTGASQITSPSGKLLAQAPEDDDFIAVVEIDPAEAQNKRINPYNDLYKDRRPEFYRDITDD